MSEQVFKVRCTQCAVVMKFFPRAAESQLTCPKCGQRMRVKTPLAAGATAASPVPARPAARQPAAAAKPAGAKPVAARSAAASVKRTAAPAATARRPVRAAAPAAGPADWTDFPTAGTGTPTLPRSLAPLPGGPPAKKAGWFSKFGKRPKAAASFPAANAPRAVYAAPAPARQPASGGSRILKKLLLGVAGLIGGVVGLAVLLVAIGLVLAGRPQSKTTMTVLGWSVDAPGRLAPGPNGDQPNSKNIYHRTTNSEFSLAGKRVAEPGQSFTIELIVQGMKMNTSLRDVQPVERSGTSGYRFAMLVPEHGLWCTAEIFKIDDSHVLVATYLPGQERQRSNRGKARHDEEKTREFDDPEAFFASLRRG